MSTPEAYLADTTRNKDAAPIFGTVLKGTGKQPDMIEGTGAQSTAAATAILQKMLADAKKQIEAGDSGGGGGASSKPSGGGAGAGAAMSI